MMGTQALAAVVEALLTDEHGISESALRNLDHYLRLTGNPHLADIVVLHTDATDGRYYLPDDKSFRELLSTNEGE